MKENSLKHLILRAEALMQTNWLHAIQLLESATQLYPSNPRAYTSLGEFYLKRGLYSQAIENLQTALKLQPDNNELKYMIANCFFAKGDHKMAVIYYDQIKGPWHDVRYNKALAMAFMDKPEESVAIIRELLSEVDHNPFIYFLMIEQLFKMRDFDSAEHYIQMAEQKTGFHSHLSILKAILYSRKGIWLKAYDAYEMADKANQIINVDQLYSFAYCAEKLGLFDKAIALYYRTLKENPYYESCYEELVRLLIQKGELDKAEELLNKARTKLSSLNPMLKLLRSRLTKERDLS